MSSGPSPSVRLSEEKLARAALTYLAEPADPALGALLAVGGDRQSLARTRSVVDVEVVVERAALEQ